MAGLVIRDAGEADMPAVCAIYNHAVAHTTAIWNDRTVDLADRLAWWQGRKQAGYPLLVAVDASGAVMGYASFGDWRAFDGFRHTVEHSVYVAPDRQGAGVGRALMVALIDRARALQRQQRLILHEVDRHLVGHVVEKIRDIVILGRAVDDDIHPVLAPGHHQVVQDAAIVGEQQRVAHAVHAQAGHVAGQHRLQRSVLTLAGEQHLAHVADVEQPGLFARPQMLGHDAFILDGHLVSGERHHPAPAGAVPSVERQLQDRRLFAPLILKGIEAV